MKPESERSPVAVIGAGPIGLAVATHLLARGFSPLILEAGDRIAGTFEATRHVRLFSPWRHNMDPAAIRLLQRNGWQLPSAEEFPTAGEIVDEYLAPLAALPAMQSGLRLNRRVTAVTREGFDKAKTEGRENADFVVRTAGVYGNEEYRARAIVDASGTWLTPNPLGANGLPAQGEAEHFAQIAYGMPDVLGSARARYAGKRVLVVGAGHSAIGTLVALAQLLQEKPLTRIAWAIRGSNLARKLGGGTADGLPARAALGTTLQHLIDGRRIVLHTDVRITTLHRNSAGIEIHGIGKHGEPMSLESFDEIICAAGSRPDHTLSRELRTKFDPWLESTEALAPLIDPNVHSCGTVRPHGHRELAHPESGYYAIGAKSYGRAPNFLLATGYEQARSVAAALAGDIAAADDVQLELPKTGVCSTEFAPAESVTKSCCGGPARAEADACCVDDLNATESGESDCGASNPIKVAYSTG